MTQEELKRRLHYDPATGLFTWLISRGRCKAGSRAGRPNADGYIQIGRDYAHRLAFLYMTGAMPALVDHRDRVKSNNAWRNLRDASKALNATNAKMRSTNASGATGVSRHAASGKWQAHCGPKYLGIFQSITEASAAYEAAREAVL